MLPFRSEEVDAWCGATGEARGEVVPLAGVWALAQAWYGDRMDAAHDASIASLGLLAEIATSAEVIEALRRTPDPGVSSHDTSVWVALAYGWRWAPPSTTCVTSRSASGRHVSLRPVPPRAKR